MWPFTRQRQPAPVVTSASSLITDPLPPLALWDQFSRIGGGITPLTVSEIIQDADSGNPARLVDLYHESRQKDCHLQSVCSAAEQDITSLEWVIAAPKDPTPVETECAERLALAWEEADREAGVGHLVGESMAFGYAYDETKWELAEDGKLVPVEFKPISCRRFGFRQTDGALLFDPTGHSSVNRGGVDLLATYPGKFVEVRRRINGDVPVREGLARCLIWAATGRNWTYRDWLTLGEVGFKPSTVGVYKKGSSKEDIAHLADVVERYQATSKAVISELQELKTEWPKNAGTATGGTHKELSTYLADEMSKAVLLGTLTVDAGARGARSLGEVHDKGRDSVRDTNARVVTKALTRHVAAVFAAVNYGPKCRPPRIALVTEDQVDLEKFGKALTAMKAAGLRAIPAEWVRDEAGIPAAVAGEETLDVEVTPVGFGGNDDSQDDGKDPAKEDSQPDAA
jgi:phage gp29-like protein